MAKEQRPKQAPADGPKSTLPSSHEEVHSAEEPGVEAEQELFRRPKRLSQAGDSQLLANDLTVHEVELDLRNVELRRAQDALMELGERLAAQESQVSTLLRTTPDAIVSIDARGTIEAFNPAAERMFGYDAREVLGQNVRILMPEPYRSEHDGYLSRYLETGKAHIVGIGNLEVLGQRKDASVFPLKLGVGEWLHNGQRKFTAILHDLSEHKRRESELRESEARLQQIAEHVEDVLYVQELDGRISYVSPAYEKVWGYSAKGLYERPIEWLDAVHPEDRERVSDAFANSLKGDPFDEEFRILRPDGSLRLVHDRAFPVEDESGKVTRLIGIVTDTTEARELEKELRQAQKLEAVGTLASGIAHDFRNLLQGIMGCAHVALGDEAALAGNAESARTKASLTQIFDSAKRGAALVDQLMTFSRKHRAELRPTKIAEVLERAAPLLRRLLGEHIQLELDLRPASAVLVDPVQIEQILLNLAANARDAMPEGGTFSIEKREAVVEGAKARQLGLQTGRHVRLTVRDTGTGMDRETQARVFEPFFTTKGPGKGTGLGLSTVFGLVRRLRGHVSVRSKPGSGTAFVFHFPCVANVLPRLASGESKFRFQGAALLLEDDPMVRGGVKSYLEELGFRVRIAENPKQALALFAEDREAIDLVVSDVMLPGAVGPKLVQTLREQGVECPVLYISADPPEELYEKGLLSSSDALLEKPFDKRALAEKLRSILDSHFERAPEDRRGGSAHVRAAQGGSTQARPAEAVSTGIRPRPQPERSSVILVVEDEKPALFALRVLFEDLGYEVLAASTPSEALRAARDKRRIDLLLTDQLLPERSGDQLARELRGLFPDLKVVFMSGLTERPSPALGEFLLKPIDFDHLTRVVERLLGCDDTQLQNLGN